MPNQPQADARIDPILTDISVGYQLQATIWEDVFPVIEVEDKSAKYYEFAQSEWARDEAQKRAPGTPSEGGGFPLSEDDYNCEETAFHTTLPDETEDTIGSDIDIETAKTQFVTGKIELNAEVRVAELLFNTATWGATSIGGGDEWVQDSSTPVSDMEDEIDEIEEATGQIVNTIVFGMDVWRVLKHHPVLLDRLASDELQVLSTGFLAQLLDVDRILIGRKRINNAKRGEDDNFERIWEDDVWLGHVAQEPGIMTPTAGYSFIWPREGQRRAVRRWRYEAGHADKIEAFQSDDFKVVGADLGRVIEDPLNA